MLQFPLCHLHFCLPFSQLFQKYLKIKWLKLKMKRKGWKREETKGEKRLGGDLKRISSECRRKLVFSVLIGSVPTRLSLQLPWLCLGSILLFPFVCIPSDSKRHMEITHIALTTDLGHNHSSLNLIGGQEKTSFCDCQQWSIPTKQTPDARRMGKCPNR